MPSSGGMTNNLSEGRMKVLQAILSSVSSNHENGQDGGNRAANGGRMSEEQLHRISNKLGEIFGEDPQIEGDGTRRNEKGELVDEEGLPIIDINEPVSTSSITSPLPSGHFDDPNLLPLWTLSPEERARRRAERERTLDILEQEERWEEEQEEKSERERFLADLERRKEAAKSEMENLKKAKELQKKMGRALLRSVISPKEDDGEMGGVEEIHAKEISPKPATAIKAVSFADSVKGEIKTESWGDVVPAKLNQGQTPAWSSKQTMKMEVIERRSVGGSSPRASEAVGTNRDSDDESIPDNGIPDDAAESVAQSESVDNPRLTSRAAHDEDSDGHSSNGFMDDEDPNSDWDDEKFDVARHQREVALEYYEKRKTIGAEVVAAMRAHSHDAGEGGWDQPIVPLEASLASAPPKPPISRFMIERAPKGVTLPSHSLGPYIVPSSQSHLLTRAIRYGRLREDGELEGGDAGDSEDEIDGPPLTEERLLQLLNGGEMINVGPRASAEPGVSIPASLSTTKAPMAGSKVTNPQPTAKPSFPGSSTHQLPMETDAISPAAVDGVVVESPLSRNLPHSAPVVIESPSFPAPNMPSQSLPSPPKTNPLPVVMNAEVKETTTSSRSEGINPEKGNGRKKVSRFLAERS